jgi:hypothetical protein
MATTDPYAALPDPTVAPNGSDPYAALPDPYAALPDPTVARPTTAPRPDPTAPGVLRSGLEGFAGGARQMFLEQLRGVGELGVKTFNRSPAGAALGWLTGADTAAMDREAETAVSETYDPAIERTARSLAYSRSVNPTATSVGEVGGGIGATVPGLVIGGPVGLGAQMGIGAFGRERATGATTGEAAGQATIEGVIAGTLGKVLPGANKWAAKVAPTTNRAVNYLARAGTMTGINEGALGGFGGLSALGPRGDGDFVQGALETIESPMGVLAGVGSVLGAAPRSVLESRRANWIEGQRTARARQLIAEEEAALRPPVFDEATARMLEAADASPDVRARATRTDVAEARNELPFGGDRTKVFAAPPPSPYPEAVIRTPRGGSLDPLLTPEGLAAATEASRPENLVRRVQGGPADPRLDPAVLAAEARAARPENQVRRVSGGGPVDPRLDPAVLAAEAEAARPENLVRRVQGGPADPRLDPAVLAAEAQAARPENLVRRVQGGPADPRLDPATLAAEAQAARPENQVRRVSGGGPVDPRLDPAVLAAEAQAARPENLVRRVQGGPADPRLDPATLAAEAQAARPENQVRRVSGGPADPRLDPATLAAEAQATSPEAQVRRVSGAKVAAEPLMTPEGLTAATEKSAPVKTPSGESMVAPKAFPEPTIKPGDFVEVFVDGEAKPAVRVAAVADDGSVRVLGREGFIPREDVAIVRRATKGEVPELPRTGRTSNAQESARPVPEIRPAVNPEPAPPVEAVPQPAPPAFKPGQKVDVLTPDGKVASRSELVLKVEPDGVTIKQRASGKQVKIPAERVAATEAPVGQLPATAMEEKPVSLGRNNARRGALGIGGGKSFGGNSVIDTAIDATMGAVKATGRGVGGLLSAAGRSSLAVTQDLIQKLERNPETAAEAVRMKKVVTEASTLRADPAIQSAIRESEIGLKESGAVRADLAPIKTSGKGVQATTSKFYRALVGEAPLSTVSAPTRRVIASMWKANRVTLGWAKGVEGLNQGGFAEGKGNIRYLTPEFLREINNATGEQRNAIVREVFAKPNGLSVEAASKMLNESGMLDGPDAIVHKNALEKTRVFKNMASDLVINGRAIKVQDIDPRGYVRRTADSAANRVSFVKEYKGSHDPSLGDAALKASIKDMSEASKELIAATFKEWHGISSSAEAPIYDAISKQWQRAQAGTSTGASIARGVGNTLEVAGDALKAGKSLALTASPVSNTLGIPGFAGVVGTENLVRGMKKFATSNGHMKRMTDLGILPDVVAKMGDVTKMKTASNAVSQTIDKIHRPVDRVTGLVAALSGEAWTEAMKRGPSKFFANRYKTMLQNLNYAPELAESLAKGKGTKEQYHQVIRDVVQAATGQGRDIITKGPESRSPTIANSIPFYNFASQQLRSSIRILDTATRAAAKGDKAGFGHSMAQFVEKNFALGVTGAAMTLAWAAIKGGSESVEMLAEDPGAAIGEVFWRAWGGAAAQALAQASGAFSEKDMSLGESLAKMNFAVGAAADVGKAVSASVESAPAGETFNADPLINLFFNRTPLAKHARDMVGLATGFETGAKVEPLRRATSSFYEFAKDNPEFMQSKLDPNYKVDVTPYNEILRKLSTIHGFTMDYDTQMKVLRIAGLEGKDAKDIATSLKAKRLFSKFKKEDRDFAIGKFQRDHGATAARRIAMYDMMLEALADQIESK